MQQETYELRPLETLDDMAEKNGFGHIGQVRFGSSGFALDQIGFSHHRMNPGLRHTFGHTHDKAEEVYVVISGSGRVKLDDEIVELTKLDALRVPPKVIRCFEAGPEGLEFLAFGASHPGDGEILPGWWTD